MAYVRPLLLLVLLASSNALRGPVSNHLNVSPVSGEPLVNVSESVTRPASQAKAAAAHIKVEKVQQGQTFSQKIMHGLEQLRHSWKHNSVMPFLFGLGMLVIFMCAIVDIRTHVRADSAGGDTQTVSPRRTTSQEPASPTRTDGDAKREPPERSIAMIACLTSYRFFTGFLAATWVPFLIAKEGDNLIGQPHMLSTASFMGIAKLIYGFSICLNPFFGLLSDRLAATTPLGGRTTFLLAGIALGGMGIYAARTASDSHDIVWYLVSCCLWMLGEAMADITTETVAPEMLPPSQYDVAAAIRSVHSIMGCVLGYIALLFAAHFEFQWQLLYTVYVAVMLLSALPTLACMRSMRCDWKPRGGRGTTGPLFASISEAYIAPTRYAGGFGRICVAAGIFCLGSAPLFFNLLIIHDLVGIKDSKRQQMHFSYSSIVFLIGAVGMAICIGLQEKVQGQEGGRRLRQRSRQAEDEASAGSTDEAETAPADAGDAGAGPPPAKGTPTAPVDPRWSYLFWSICIHAVSCAVIPFIALLQTEQSRLILLYSNCLILGMCFGSVYSRVQACMWILLPRHADIANAMGFMAVCKCVGGGSGNFIAGMMLDNFRGFFKEGASMSYGNAGYFVMCFSSSFWCFVAAGIILSIAREQQQNRHLLFSKGSWFCLC